MNPIKVSINGLPVQVHHDEHGHWWMPVYDTIVGDEHGPFSTAVAAQQDAIHKVERNAI
jgi:hypothetical protein